MLRRWSRQGDPGTVPRSDMRDQAIRNLARSRWRVAIALSLCVFALYFGFLFLAAFAKDLMGTELVPGLSVGIVLGALVILGSWVTTWAYAHWANTRFDGRRAELAREPKP